MLDPPRHDWAFYDERTRSQQDAWLGKLTPNERFALYADMFDTIWDARRNIEGDWDRLDQWRWQQKLAMRLRMVGAFRKLDERRRERIAAENINALRAGWTN